ncbi:MAG TPA: hypothetical protein VLZ74_09880 [Methylocella sp.]|nr:hypothetical protein [Methylocella sp.]
MRKGRVCGFAAVSVAAILLPLACDAQSNENNNANKATNTEPISPAISQSTDRADARIAILKADLRLTPDQAQNWPRLQAALHEIAVKQAKNWAAANELQTGRASSSPGMAETSNRNNQAESSSEKDKRMAARDAIDGMRDQADTLQIEAADLRDIADAAQPLYDLLNDRQRHLLVKFVHEEIKGDRMDWHSRRF